MNRYYKAIYCGSGKCFNLVMVYSPDTSERLHDLSVKELHMAGWAVLSLDSDTRTPPKEINLK